MLHGWYLELMRDRSEATWPGFGGKRLGRWHSSQTDSVISFRLEMDYRKELESQKLTTEKGRINLLKNCMSLVKALKKSFLIFWAMLAVF